MHTILGFDWSNWIVLIKREIIVATGSWVWLVSADKWKASLDYNVVHAQQENLLVLAQTTRKDSIRNQIIY